MLQKGTGFTAEIGSTWANLAFSDSSFGEVKGEETGAEAKILFFLLMSLNRGELRGSVFKGEKGNDEVDGIRVFGHRRKLLRHGFPAGGWTDGALPMPGRTAGKSKVCIASFVRKLLSSYKRNVLGE